MRNRSQLTLGVILILLGIWFLAQRQFPALNQFMHIYLNWPLDVVAAGILIFLLGLLLNAPGMAIPACIVAGIGGILYYQNLANDYVSWNFMWTLIPGFVGVGEIISGVLGERNYKTRNGANLIVTSLIMFVVFAAIFGRLSILGPYGPAILLILVGVWFLVRGVWHKN
jgi:hypothetical protein